MAPQFTATKGFARRVPLPWIARAISSLPTPDSPSSQHRYGRGGRLFRGLENRLHRRRTCDHVGNGQRAFVAAFEPLQFARERSRREHIAQRDFQPFGACRLHHEVGRARAHGRHDIVDAAMGGLHDHRNIEAGLAHEGQNAEPIEIGHDQVEDHGIDRRVGSGEELDRRIAAVRDDRLVAVALNRGFEQATLDRIVIDDEHNFRHEPSQLYRIGALSPVSINGLLSRSPTVGSG